MNNRLRYRNRRIYCNRWILDRSIRLKLKLKKGDLNMAKQKTRDHSLTKKSIIAGGLIGTGGFFIAKAIGLIYSIPFSSILGSDAYMAYYGTAYRIYSYILNVFTAGAPMAIATMTAKYITRKNYKTVLNVHRLSILAMSLLGFLGMIVMIVSFGRSSRCNDRGNARWHRHHDESVVYSRNCDFLCSDIERISWLYSRK